MACIHSSLQYQNEPSRIRSGLLHVHISTLNTSLLQLPCDRSEFVTDRAALVQVLAEVLERARNKTSVLDGLECKQQPIRETFDYNLNRLHP